MIIDVYNSSITKLDIPSDYQVIFTGLDIPGWVIRVFRKDLGPWGCGRWAALGCPDVTWVVNMSLFSGLIYIYIYHTILYNKI